jgi:hypothetical protein
VAHRRREVGDRGRRLDAEQVRLAAGARDALGERGLERDARGTRIAADHEGDVVFAVTAKHDRRGASERARDLVREVPSVAPPNAVRTEQAPHQGPEPTVRARARLGAWLLSSAS